MTRHHRALTGLSLCVGLALVPAILRPVHACSPGLPSVQILYPADGATDVPRNRGPLVRASWTGDVSFTLTGPRGRVDAITPVVRDQVRSLAAQGHGLWLRLDAALEPNATYELVASASNAYGSGVVEAHATFTTGDSLDDAPPRYPGLTALRGLWIGGGCNSCDSSEVATCQPAFTLADAPADDPVLIDILPADRSGQVLHGEPAAFPHCYVAAATDLAGNRRDPERVCCVEVCPGSVPSCADERPEAEGTCYAIGTLPPDAEAQDAGGRDGAQDVGPGLEDRAGCGCGAAGSPRRAGVLVSCLVLLGLCRRTRRSRAP